MSKNGGSEKQTKAEVENYEQLKEFIHTQGSTDKAFSSTDTNNALKIMMTSEKEFLDNAMRYDLPSNRIVLALAFEYGRYKEHGFEEGINFLMLLCGLLTSKKGKRIQIMSDTVIGERKFKENTSGNGLWNKAKNFMTPGT